RVRLQAPPLARREAASITIALMILSRSHEAQLFAAIAAIVRAAYSWPRLKSSRPFPVGTSFQYPARARRPPPFNLTNGRVFREGASVRRACSGLLEAALK